MIAKLLNASHRYLGLIVCAQALLWSISGFLMYSLDFSDLYAPLPAPPLSLPDKSWTRSELEKIVQNHLPGQHIQSIQIQNLAGQATYLITSTNNKHLLLSATGQRLDPLAQAVIQEILKSYQINNIQSIQLLPTSQGNYASSEPIYRVKLNDSQHSEIYLSPTTGKVLARRKALWGLYNWMWEAHLMKYTPSAPLNKFVLLLFAVLNAVVALTGLFKFFRWGRLFSKDAA